MDIYPRVDENYKKIYPLTDIEKCLKESDVVVLTLPLTSETRYMMNENRFNSMKDGSVLVNIARGAVVEENALIKALDTKLSGAILDVFEEEPLTENNPLWHKENVIITPHNSFIGDNNETRLTQVVLSNLGEKYEKRSNAHR